MDWNLECTYNKQTNVFEWSETDNKNNREEIENAWYSLTQYIQHNGERKIKLVGIEACDLYLNNISDKNTTSLPKDFLLFLKFKEHVRDFIYYICYGGNIVFAPSICDKYLNLFEKCSTLYRENDINKLILALKELQNEEAILLPKIYGLRAIDMRSM